MIRFTAASTSSGADHVAAALAGQRRARCTGSRRCGWRPAVVIRYIGRVLAPRAEQHPGQHRPVRRVDVPALRPAVQRLARARGTPPRPPAAHSAAASRPYRPGLRVLRAAAARCRWGCGSACRPSAATTGGRSALGPPATRRWWRGDSPSMHAPEHLGHQAAPLVGRGRSSWSYFTPADIVARTAAGRRACPGRVARSCARILIRSLVSSHSSAGLLGHRLPTPRRRRRAGRPAGGPSTITDLAVLPRPTARSCRLIGVSSQRDSAVTPR